MKKKIIERHRKSETAMHYRTLSVRRDTPDGTPATYDEKTRSVEVIGATEEPVDVFDWERWELVREILLMDGLEMPAARQVPLLDSHARYSTASVLGSYRDMQAGKGQLTGRVFFSSTPEADGPHTKLREGHITDFSAGYRVIESTWIDDGQTAVIKGRSFAGPVRVTTRWRIKELSICPIGADELAKVRAEHNNQKPPASGGEKETDEMNERLKKWLISRGLPESATDDEAWAFMEKLEIKRAAEIPPPAPKPAVPDVDAERNAATVNERARIAEIDGCARAFNCPDELREKLIKEGTDTAKALRAIMDHAIASRQAGPGYRPPVEHGADERDKFRDAALDSLLLRAPSDGLKLRPEKPAPGAMDLRGHSLRELARHCLVLASQPTGGNPLEMVGRALTTSDLPRILAAGANKALLAGWEAAEETWRTWCGVGSVPDFKIQNLVRASEASSLDEIPEHGEYKYGNLADSKEQVQVVTFGKLFAITRQAIINDDLGALVTIPAKQGQAAARKVGDLPYAVLTANAAMGDGAALFVAGHSNIGTQGTIGVATLAEAIKLMKLQKDTQGLQLLNIRPRYLLAPVTLEGAAEVFFRSEKFADSNTVATDSSLAATRANPYSGTYFTRVYEARLDASSVAHWYLAAEKGMTVNVFFLSGMEAPYMEQKTGWTVDGVEFKVRIDAAAKAVDWRGLLYNAG